MFQPIQAFDESEWTEEYAKLVISSHARRPLPLPIQRIGSSHVIWQEPIPGWYHVHAAGGSVDDRYLARAIVAGQLDAYGLRRITFTVGGPELRKTADWDEVQSKAIRLMNDGSVQILRNAPDTVVGHVIGDHGDYQTEISRQDPDSNVIDHWQCECPWDQFAWQRTRQWKSLEGRPCAHILATHWTAQGTPLDVEYDPTTGQPISPENQHGQLGLPMAIPAVPPGGMAPPGQSGASPPAPAQQLSIPGIDPGMMTATPPVPGSNVIPEFPGAKPPPPVSVPGAKVPDPSNPIQWPGGTFSSTQDWKFGQPWEKGWQGKGMIDTTGKSHAWIHDEAQGQPGPHHDEYAAINNCEFDYGHTFYIDEDGSVDGAGRETDDDVIRKGLKDRPELKVDSGDNDWKFTAAKTALRPSIYDRPTEAPKLNLKENKIPQGGTGLGIVFNDGSTYLWTKPPDHHGFKLDELGKGPGDVFAYLEIEKGKLFNDSGSSKQVINPQLEQLGFTLVDNQRDWHFSGAKDTFQNSDMVRINKEEYGLAEGKSEEHGAGQYRTVPMNSIGEVLGQDPTTGWIDVIFPIHDSGPMEPYHVRCFLEPKDVTPMPNVKKPGPFIRRKR